MQWTAKRQEGVKADTQTTVMRISLDCLQLDDFLRLLDEFWTFFETHILVGWMRCGTTLRFPPAGTQPREPTLKLQPTTLTFIL